MNDLLKDLLKTGRDSLREEGVWKAAKKAGSWFAHYISWKRRMIRGFLREHIEWYDIVWVLILARKKQGLNKVIRYTGIEGGLDYSIRKKLKYQIINEDETASVVSPDYFEGEESRVLNFSCPPIYMSEFPDAHVYGSSEMFAVGEVAVSDMYMRDLQEKRYNIQGGCVVKYKTGGYMLAAYKDLGKVVEKAVSMVGWVSGNYYHFTFEILSRLALVDREEKYRTWPILVDRGAVQVPQMKALLDHVNIYRHPVILVENCERIRVKKLLYISRNLWMPLNFRPDAMQYPQDYLFSGSVADNIRKAVLHERRNIRGYGKIFLSRKKCQNQRLVNAAEIEEIFRENGFRIIYPEELSFEEEVSIFHCADLIVGPTGAALTNLVYCKAGAIAAVIAPAGHKAYCFSNIAHMVGVKFYLLGAETVKKGKAESMDTFMLDTKKCGRFVKQIAGSC